MKRIAPLLTILLLAGGCLKSVELNESGKYACVEDSDCLFGMTCHTNEFGENKCFTTSSTQDTARNDAADDAVDTSEPPDTTGICALLQPPPDDACTNSSDQSIVNGFVSIEQAVLSCLASTGSSDAAKLACSCFHEMRKLSVRCSTCFGRYGECLSDNCNDPCNPLKGGSLQSPVCIDCIAKSGCKPPFRACSGLP